MISVSSNFCVITVLSRSDMTHMPSISCEVYSPGFFFFFLNASAPGTLAPFNILDKIFHPHSFATFPSAFMFHFCATSSVFPLPAFSSVYTSAVIYLLFCGSNVVNMCLAPLHAPLICSQLRNRWRNHSRPTKLLIVHSAADTGHMDG